MRRRERTYRLLHDGECDVLLVVREEERGRVVHESQQGLERRRLRERGRGVEQWELVRRIRRRLTIQRRQTVGVLRLFAQKKDVSRRRGGQLYVGEKASESTDGVDSAAVFGDAYRRHSSSFKKSTEIGPFSGGLDWNCPSPTM